MLQRRDNGTRRRSGREEEVEVEEAVDDEGVRKGRSGGDVEKWP